MCTGGRIVRDEQTAASQNSLHEPTGGNRKANWIQKRVEYVEEAGKTLNFSLSQQLLPEVGTPSDSNSAYAGEMPDALMLSTETIRDRQLHCLFTASLPLLYDNRCQSPQSRSYNNIVTKKMSKITTISSIVHITSAQSKRKKGTEILMKYRTTVWLAWRVS